MSVIADYAGWVAAGIMSLGMLIQGVASHSRLNGRQDADRELFKTKLQAEADARQAADRLLEEKLKGWGERLKQVQAEQERTRDMAEKVGRLAQAVESLAERVTESQDRTDERFEELRASLSSRA